MSLSDQKLKSFSKLISSLADQPRMQPQDLKAYFDSSPEELRQAHNNLCDALCAPDAAASLGFARTAGVPADTVQAAVEHVQAQVSDAVSGNLPSGSVTSDKLAQDVRNHFTTIENSVSGEAAARASADNGLQSQIDTHTSQIAAKCEVICGSYIGDGTENRTISLGRTPKAVLLMENSGMMYNANSHETYGGLAVTNSPVIYQYDTQQAVAIATNGFKVTVGGEYNCLMTNSSGTVYNYIALI